MADQAATKQSGITNYEKSVSADKWDLFFVFSSERKVRQEKLKHAVKPVLKRFCNQLEQSLHITNFTKADHKT